MSNGCMVRRVKKGPPREISLVLTTALLVPELAANKKGAKVTGAPLGLIWLLLKRNEM